MKEIFTIFFILLVFPNIWSQNLVPDPIFSDTIACPDSQNDFDSLRLWFRPNFASSDLYCSCFPTDNPPFSIFENKKANSGDCFIGLFMGGILTSGNEAREYAGIRLSDKLEKNEKYCFSVNLVSSSKANYVVQNIHFGFDSDSVYENTGTKVTVDKYYNLSDEIVFDSTDWRRFEVEFTATGTEKYLYLGNFDSTSEAVNHDYNSLTSPPFLFNVSYYFFDNVSLTKCLPPLEEDFTIYPNPSTGGVVYTEFDADTTGVIGLYNSLGQMVRSRNITPGNFKGELFQGLASGVYIVTIQTDSGYRREQKLVVTK